MGNFSHSSHSDRGGFKKFGNRNSGKSFGGGKNFDRQDGGKREMFQATCSNCGKRCEVPFRPTGSRPIFCSMCFDKQGNTHEGRTERTFSDKPRFEDKRTNGFGRGGSEVSDLKEQMEKLNKKLDRILDLLIPSVATEAAFEIARPRKQAPIKKETEVVFDVDEQPKKERKPRKAKTVKKHTKKA